MPAVDSLLRLLVQHGGDELRLEVGRPPALLKDGAPLSLFLPTATVQMVDQLLLGLRGVERRQRVAAEGTIRFFHEPEGMERFAVALWGEEARQAWFGRGAAMERGPRASTPAAPTDAREARRERRSGGAGEESSLSPAVTPSVAVSPPAAAPPPSPASWVPATAADAPVGEALGRLLQRAIELSASDLHLAVGERPVVRVDGRLRSLAGGPVEAELIGDLPDDGTLIAAGRRVRVTRFQAGGQAAVALRLPPAAPPSLAALGHPVPLDALAGLDHGLVLVGGAVGSGKTTTLAALVAHRLATRGGLIVTLEDPIEHRFEAPEGSIVRQRQLGRDVPDAATGLREALRQDPDVIVIGELRDAESILLALTAAETGQLVLATLHCRSAVSAVERVLDAVPPARQAQVRGQLAEALRAVVVQRLLPRRGGGRVLAAELLRGTRQVASLLRDGKTGQLATALQTGAADGMMALERHLADLVARGLVTAADAADAANDPESLRAYGG
jgi:twitching motility protein PilT